MRSIASVAARDAASAAHSEQPSVPLKSRPQSRLLQEISDPGLLVDREIFSACQNRRDELGRYEGRRLGGLLRERGLRVVGRPMRRRSSSGHGDVIYTAGVLSGFLE
jgi:hypothetical protein